MTNFATSSSINAEKIKNTRLMVNSQAPAFICKDVYGNILKLEDFKGKTILLSFHRNVGCPICNLRFHELE